MVIGSVEAVAAALALADAQHAADVRRLDELDDEQLDYIDRAGELDDELSDGIEARCP